MERADMMRQDRKPKTPTGGRIASPNSAPLGPLEAARRNPAGREPSLDALQLRKLRAFALKRRAARPWWPRTHEIAAEAAKRFGVSLTTRSIVTLLTNGCGLEFRRNRWLDPQGKADVQPWQAQGLSRVERIVLFLEGLPITKGHLRGERMRLLPSQREFVERVYGGDPVRLAVLSEPRGNGKTGFVAGWSSATYAGRKRSRAGSATRPRWTAGRPRSCFSK